MIIAIAYHDMIYNPIKSNNEEKSAQLAEKRLPNLSFPQHLKTLCTQMILAIKSHQSGNRDINLFTDVDWYILGAEAEVYKNYTEQI